MYDQIMPRENEARITYDMYSDYVESGQFFNEPEVVAGFFLSSKNIEPLFEHLRA